MSTNNETNGDGESALEMRDVRLKLGSTGSASVVFQLPELTVAEGDRVALTGPSGCGKSTLLHLVSGLLRPDTGSLRVLGTDPTKLRQPALDRFRGTNLGFIFQTFQLLGAFTALENVRVGLRFGRAIPRREQKERATQLLERVGLGNRLHIRPHKLSVGERQRVAIARALANRPKLLLADEPTGSLDPETGDSVFSLLNEISDEEGCALLFVTHDLGLVSRLPRQFDCRELVTHESLSPSSSAAA